MKTRRDIPLLVATLLCIVALPAQLSAEELEFQSARVVALPDREEEPRVPLVNIKTNALETAMLVANIGVEFRITPRLSFDMIWHYSPYDYFVSDRKIRIYGIEPEVRFWWCEALVKGHFVGLHVPIAGFNVQLSDRFRYQDPNHALCGVGISYGYAMPLDKRGKWGIEFTIGVGYVDVKYDVYSGKCNGAYLRTERRNYFGPTRLGVDISYRIDMKKVRR
jgi:hypothetical protein